MVTANDKDLTAFLDGSYVAYVCFEQDADNFRIISISPSSEILYEKEKATSVETQKGWAFYQQFKNGVKNDFQVLGGMWKRAPGMSEYFYTEPGDQTMSLNDSEVIYTDTYENLKKTKTHYSLTIRRSTLRFAQNYRFPSDDIKTTSNVDETGRCLRY
jgi:hypothetical protein